MSSRRTALGSLNAPDVRDVVVYIYALCEPIDGAVRYIGKSSSPEKRLTNHLAAGRHKIAAWVAQLAADGLRPQLCILEAVPAGCDAASRERLAIGTHLARGCRLLNSDGTDAGRGPYSRASDLPNQGAVSLAALGITQRQIAVAIGCAQSNVSNWFHGKQLPDSVMRARLEDTFGIYWRLWDIPSGVAQEGAA